MQASSAPSSTSPSYYAQFKQFSFGQKCFLCGVPALTAATVIRFLRRRGVPIITASVCTSFVTYKVLKWSWLRCQKAVAISAQELQEQPIGPKLPAPRPAPAASTPASGEEAAGPKQKRKVKIIPGQVLGLKQKAEQKGPTLGKRIQPPQELEKLEQTKKRKQKHSHIPIEISTDLWLTGSNHPFHSIRTLSNPVSHSYDLHTFAPDHFEEFIQALQKFNQKPTLLFGRKAEGTHLCLVIGYLMWQKGLSYAAALKEVQSKYLACPLSEANQQFLENFQTYLSDAYAKHQDMWNPQQIYKDIWLTTSELGREGSVENDDFDPFGHLRNPGSAHPLPEGVKGFTASGESLRTWGANHFKRFLLDIEGLHDAHRAQPTHVIGQIQLSLNPRVFRGYTIVYDMDKPIHIPREVKQPVLLYGAGLKQNNLCLLIGYIMWDKLIRYEEALEIVKKAYSAASPSKEEQAFLQDFQQHLVDAHKRNVDLLD